MALSVQTGMAQETQSADEEESSEAQQFGGPNSVPGQLSDDERLTESITGREWLRDYFAWKDRLKDEQWLFLSVDYTAAILGSSNTLGKDDVFAGGAVRFFGRWDLIGRESGNTGTFVWKIEHRHKYTDIPPSGTASQIGYVGLILPILSDIGTRLTNLYWKTEPESRPTGDRGLACWTQPTRVDLYANSRRRATGFLQLRIRHRGRLDHPCPMTLHSACTSMPCSPAISTSLAFRRQQCGRATDPFNGFSTLRRP